MTPIRKLRSRGSTATSPALAGSNDAAPTSRRPLVVWALVRLGILVIDYAVLGLLGFVIIPLLGEFMLGSSAVASSPRATLSQQLIYWLVPFIALTCVFVVGALACFKMLWRAGTRWLDAPSAPAKTVVAPSETAVAESNEIVRITASKTHHTPNRSKNNRKKVATS